MVPVRYMHVGPRHLCPAVSLHTLPESSECREAEALRLGPTTRPHLAPVPRLPRFHVHHRESAIADVNVSRTASVLLHSRMQSSYARAGICTVLWTDLRVGWRRRYSFQHSLASHPRPSHHSYRDPSPAGCTWRTVSIDTFFLHHPCLPFQSSRYFTLHLTSSHELAASRY